MRGLWDINLSTKRSYGTMDRALIIILPTKRPYGTKCRLIGYPYDCVQVLLLLFRRNILWVEKDNEFEVSFRRNVLCSVCCGMLNPHNCPKR